MYLFVFSFFIFLLCFVLGCCSYLIKKNIIFFVFKYYSNSRVVLFNLSCKISFCVNHRFCLNCLCILCVVSVFNYVILIVSIFILNLAKCYLSYFNFFCFIFFFVLLIIVVNYVSYFYFCLVFNYHSVISYFYLRY